MSAERTWCVSPGKTARGQEMARGNRKTLQRNYNAEKRTEKSREKRDGQGGGGQLPRSMSGLQSPDALDSSTPSRTNFTALVLACFLSRSAIAGSFTSK